jgi:hypothetical protein
MGIPWLKWGGHLIYASGNRMIKRFKISKWKEVGKWEDKNRLRWEECVWQDIRILGIRNWINVPSDREQWPAIARDARADTGLYCQC